MTALTLAARATLEAEGLTPQSWTIWCQGPGETQWHGDECGCSDDRCIGHHHDAAEDCGCLTALLHERSVSYVSAAAAAVVWEAAHDAEHSDEVEQLLDDWRQTCAPGFDRVWLVTTGARPGLYGVNRWNDDEHRLWRPDLDRMVRWAAEK